MAVHHPSRESARSLPDGLRPLLKLRREDLALWFAVLAVVLAVGCYYLWAVRASGQKFHWGYNLGGYYNYLGRAFAMGQLHVPIQPDPALLALPDPYDPSVGDSVKMHDMALYKGRYYLYHGAGPAVMLFAPWRLITGYDLPENFGLFLFCFGGFLFSCGSLLRILALAGTRAGPPTLALMMLALGICQAAPFLMNRGVVYELAIGGGYFCVSAGFFFLIGAVRGLQPACGLAAAGLMFGLAISCRPHLALAGAIALAGLIAIRITAGASGRAARDAAVFAIPFAAAGVAVAAYNYARFDSLFEFGIRYLLTGPGQNRVKTGLENVTPGLYYLLAAPPDFSAVFPWVRLVFRYPFGLQDHGLPPAYFVELTAGAFMIAPFSVAAWFVPARRAAGEGHASARILLWSMLASAAAIIGFLSSTGWSTQRYTVDFLPLMVLAAVAGIGIRIGRSAGWQRAALRAVFAVCVVYSAVANLALGITGPYDEVLKNRTASYLRIARWFSPIQELRPLANPDIRVEFSADFSPQPEDSSEPLVTIGQHAFRHFVYSRRSGGRLRIVSRSVDSEEACEMEEPGSRLVGIQVTYSGEAGILTVGIDGRQAVHHRIGGFVTAPAQVTPGENRIDVNMTSARFSGRMEGVRRIVRARGGQ